MVRLNLCTPSGRDGSNTKHRITVHACDPFNSALNLRFFLELEEIETRGSVEGGREG